ncbi:putative DNA endonuclease SmrA [BD1-7 clade bacterium]|uniref:Putative DNA endonuclease SmrA n=1 Tax=BD1-7 clade bacterium TaxID=2029982 RepID=A0A5S9QLB0_9GAMM|nr:putative DNA endonuclease SmrA [BD1-7 clade bacterium]
MASDEDIFMAEMGGVTPIVQTRADVGQVQNADSGVEERRNAAVSESEDPNHLSSQTIRQVGPHDVVSFKRPGIQDGVYRQLRLGKYIIDARLDLHRMTVEESRKSTFDFIIDCMGYDLRAIMILHGKGDRDPERKAVLKSHVVHWLEEMPEVMAYHSAQPHHGGTGALYVLLRKSEKMKRQNRERFGLRGS